MNSLAQVLQRVRRSEDKSSLVPMLIRVAIWEASAHLLQQVWREPKIETHMTRTKALASVLATWCSLGEPMGLLH